MGGADSDIAHVSCLEYFAIPVKQLNVINLIENQSAGLGMSHIARERQQKLVCLPSQSSDRE